MKLVVNHAYENMGLASTQTLGPILDGLMRNTPDALEFIEPRARPRASAPSSRERDGPFGDYSQAPPRAAPRPRQRDRTVRSPGMDMKLELVAVPVSDVDRAKAFYTDQAGFNADHDHTVSDAVRFVQLTPPGSACSIALGKGVSDAPPGSVEGLQLVVDDIEAAHAELAGRGVDVSDVQDFAWGRFVFFADPDGNRWAVQQIPSR